MRELAAAARCPVVLYGLGEPCAVRPLDAPIVSPQGTRFRVLDEQAGEVTLELAIPGLHNVRNALAVWTVARRDGLPIDAVRAALASFRGVHRRLERVGEEAGVTVIDDFAHHPTEIAATLAALRQRFPGRRLIAVFEPRSLTSGRSFLMEGYVQAFSRADVVHLAPIFHAGRLRDDERLDASELRSRLERAGVRMELHPSLAAVLDAVLAGSRPGDVVVTMSSGSFDGMPRKVLAALSPSARAGAC